MTLPIALRPASDGDTALIFSSWLHSYYKSHDAKHTRRDVYYAGQHRLIGALMARAHLTRDYSPAEAQRAAKHSVLFMVACDPNDPSVVHGWCCYERRPGGKVVLHYVFTKSIYARFGVARAMLREALTDARRVACTHMTCAGSNALDEDGELRARYGFDHVPYLYWLLEDQAAA